MNYSLCKPLNLPVTSFKVNPSLSTLCSQIPSIHDYVDGHYVDIENKWNTEDHNKISALFRNLLFENGERLPDILYVFLNHDMCSHPPNRALGPVMMKINFMTH
jgi:hypothetical protein